MEIPSRQEMFNRAWNGLKSQGWKRSTVRKVFSDGGEVDKCRYTGEEGRRCAWGWVDPDGTRDADGYGSLAGLASYGIGLAAYLSTCDATWAAQLQMVHDGATDETLELLMREFAKNQRLTIPVDE